MRSRCAVLLLSCVSHMAACGEPGVFSGVLEVEVVGPPEAKVGLFNHPDAGLEAQSVTVDARRDACAVRSSFPQGATTPRQLFTVEQGAFAIAFDDALPAVPLALAAWVDVDGDGELDFEQPPVETCAAAVRDFERGPLAITRVDSLDGGFRVVAEDGSEIFDDDAQGWIFSL